MLINFINVFQDNEEYDFPAKLETNENTPHKLMTYRGEHYCFGDCPLVFKIQLLETLFPTYNIVYCLCFQDSRSSLYLRRNLGNYP
jgi:hypothetical protein